MKTTEKLQVAELLYKKGLDVIKIADILSYLDIKHLNTYLNESKIEQSKECLTLESYTSKEISYLISLGIFDKLREKLLKNQEEENVVETIISIDTFLEEKEAITRESEIERIKKLMKEEDIDFICNVCENKGKIYLVKQNGVGVDFIKCPKCKGARQNMVVRSKIDKKIIEEHIFNKRYIENDFDSDILDKSLDFPDEFKKAIHLDSYLETLNEIILEFKNGILLKNSLYLTAPDDFGKRYFLNQLIKEMLKYNMKPSELLDVLKVNSLYRNYKYKELEEMLTKDMVFLDFVASTHMLNPEIFKYILNFCNERNIPVLVISRTESELLIQNRKSHNKEWLDIFKQHIFENDFSHLKEIGIVKHSTRLIHTYKKQMLEEQISNSPVKVQNYSYFAGTELVTAPEVYDILERHAEKSNTGQGITNLYNIDL